MELAYHSGQSLYEPLSSFDKWMDDVGSKILINIENSSKFKCYVCESKKRLTEHHVIPLHFGGLDFSWNLVTLCVDCHVKIHHGRDNKWGDRYWLERLENFRIKSHTERFK
jgi:5-methylcytosine-specific restriction endonuclease McrA